MILKGPATIRGAIERGNMLYLADGLTPPQHERG
jgi:hypothetical protein